MLRLFVLLRLLLIICLFGFASQSRSEETVHLQLRWHNQFQFAGYYAAIQQGYYKKVGLNVITHEGSPEHIPIAQVLKGEAQYGVANSELVLARLKGEPLIVLAAVCQHSPSVLLARKDANIYTPSDLVGKKVMIIGDYIDADFVAMFNNEHINIKNIQMIPSSYDIQDLVTGKVDAFNSYTSNEPFLLEQLKIPYTILYPRNYGIDFYSDMLFTSEQELKQHPRRVKAFLYASMQGWRYALEHPQEIIQLLQNNYQVPKSKEHLEFEANAFHSLIEPELVEIGHINPWRLQHMANTFLQAGLIHNIDALDGFIYQPDVAKERLKYYLKIAIGCSFFIILIAVVLYAAYQSIDRENRQRKQIAKELKQRSQELALHNDILQKINQGTALPLLLTELAHQIEQLHPNMICSILLLDDKNKLRCTAAPSLPAFFIEQMDGLTIGEGICGCATAAYSREHFIIKDIQQHPCSLFCQKLAKKIGARSCWSQPIIDNQHKVLGTLTIYHAEPKEPLPDDIALIESYANLAQLAIEHSRADNALRESEQRLRFVLKGSSVGFWDWKLDGHHLVEINSNEADLFRYQYPEIRSEPPEWLTFVHPDDRQNVWQSIQRLLNREQDSHQIECRTLDKQGQIRWILDRANIVQYDDKGKPLRISGTYTDISELKAAEQQIKQLAFYDVLTQLPNRRLLNDRLQHAITVGKREGKQLAVFMLDLDKFKAVNDNLGHSAGDELLQKVAIRITQQVRETDTVARFGGDEFVVLIPNLTHIQDVAMIAQAIIDALSQTFLLRETDIVNIGTSIGISFYPKHGDHPEALLNHADAALYQAKEQGRGCFRFAN